MCQERYKGAEPNLQLLGGLVWIAFLKLNNQMDVLIFFFKIECSTIFFSQNYYASFSMQLVQKVGGLYSSTALVKCFLDLYIFGNFNQHNILINFVPYVIIIIIIIFIYIYIHIEREKVGHSNKNAAGHEKLRFHVNNKCKGFCLYVFFLSVFNFLLISSLSLFKIS